MACGLADLDARMMIDPQVTDWPKFIWGGALKNKEVGPMIYADFLPKALADQSYVAAPSPHLIGQGLASLPSAMQAQKKGVSAKKIIVSL